MSHQYTFYVVTDDDLSSSQKKNIQQEIEKQVISKVVVPPTECNCKKEIEEAIRGLRSLSSSNDTILSQLSRLTQQSQFSDQDREALKMILEQVQSLPSVQPSAQQEIRGDVITRLEQLKGDMLTSFGQMEERFQAQLDNISRGVIEAIGELRLEIASRPSSNEELLNSIRTLQGELKEQSADLTSLKASMEFILPYKNITSSLKKMNTENISEMKSYIASLLKDSERSFRDIQQSVGASATKHDIESLRVNLNDIRTSLVETMGSVDLAELQNTLRLLPRLLQQEPSSGNQVVQRTEETSRVMQLGVVSLLVAFTAYLWLYRQFVYDEGGNFPY